MTLIDRPLTDFPTSHDHVLVTAMTYLAQVLRARFAVHLGQDPNAIQPREVDEPDFAACADPLAEFLRQPSLTFEERVLVLVALAPHVAPNFFDELIAEQLPDGGDFLQIGGVRGNNHRGFLPTGQTATFLIAGDDLDHQLAVQRLFFEDHSFAAEHILRLESPVPGEPKMSGRIVLDHDYIDRFTVGEITKPRLSTEFPAKRLTTEMTWDDLVLAPATMSAVQEVEGWVKNGETLLHGEWAMARQLKPGYRVLFHGPPGTGKTLTANLLGRSTGRDVYRVDLSMVVSKFIGETEKNLACLFDKAESKNWILFFDEADALFGKRTNVRDAHDRYGNQEIAYLLQRVEGYAGLVILASNLKNNIDDAFMRRFQIAVHFPAPGVTERAKLWRLGLPPIATLEDGLDIETLARQYDLTGAHIMNVVQHICLQAIARGDRVIRSADLLVGVQRELAKDGKVL